MSKEHPATRRFVSDRFLANRYEVSRATIWRWAKIGKLPPPEQLGANTSRWDLERADYAILGSAA